MKRVRTRVTLMRLGVLAVVAAAVVAGTVGAQASSHAGKLKIVWLEQGANNPYWDAQHRAAAEAARRLKFQYKTVSGNNSASDQASIMKQQVDQGVDLIMLNAIDPKAMAPALAYAKQKGVKVLNLYGVEPKATASVTFDEIRTGRVDAKYGLTLLKKRYGSAKGKVAVLMGIIGQPASDLRAKGFVDYMKKSGIDIVAQQPTGWQADKASAAMQDWLVKYPDLSMVYALSDARGARDDDHRSPEPHLHRQERLDEELAVRGVRLGRRDLRGPGREGEAVRHGAVQPRVVRLPLRQARVRRGERKEDAEDDDDRLVPRHARERGVQPEDDQRHEVAYEDVPVRAVAAGDRVEDVPLQGARQEHVIPGVRGRRRAGPRTLLTWPRA
jgi:ABC-type sugar transport system substrate-binding protein